MTRKQGQALLLRQLMVRRGSGTHPLTLARPAGGWLRRVRQALGLSFQRVADRLDVKPQAVHQLEKSESAGTITLRRLDAVAAAMGCRVVYALVPLRGTFDDLANADRDALERAVRHTMRLEGQAVPMKQKR